MKRGQRLLNLFAFGLWARIWFIAAILLSLLLLAGVLILLTPISGDPSQSNSVPAEYNQFSAVLLGIGFLVLPLAVILTLIAGWREPRHPPRAILFLFAAALVLLAGVLLTVSMYANPGSGGETYPAVILNAAMPLALLVSLPGIYSAARSWPEIRAILEEDITKRLLGIIRARGAVSFADLAKAASVPLNEIGERLDELISSGQLAATLDVERQWIYTASYLADKQHDLLYWLNQRGHIRLDELARLLKVSIPTTTEWIYQLVERDQFDGFINWRQGLVYAATASRIGSASQCPQCGGQLLPAPGNSIVCVHCGMETWSAVKKV